MTANNSWAMALGRVSIQSLLGEPLRAEIDVPSITADESATLQVGIASVDRFRAANMEFNPLLADVTLELVKRPDGRSVVRLRSTRVVNEPFLDLVVQASWANGELLRGYTLLLDPPNLRPAPAPLLPSAPAVIAPALAPAPRTATAPVAPSSSTPASASRPAPVAAPAPAAAPKQVNVVRGDTAGRIAAAHRPASATLEQMLIGLLRNNPQAFMGGNVNRLKAGVVLELPDSETVTAINPSEARQLVAAQSRDFNEYRRRLAAAAPSQDTQAPSRSATGTVQTEVREDRPADVAQDKLTLSKSAAGTEEEKIAQARQQEDSANRANELSRNLQELEQLRAATQPAGEAQAGTGTATTEAPASPAPPTPPPAPAAPEPTPTPTPAPAVPLPEVTPPPAQTGLVDELLANPLVLPAAGGLAALVGLLALLRMRQRRKSEEKPDEEAQESRFGEAEGQTVDTSEEGPVSSMMYSPSQLDAGGDVDPVAEADVYLAYGRDKQAEEILLEALRLHPEKLPVRAKLLEVYAQRNDVMAYNAAAQELYALTLGEGSEWAQARETGLTLDPDNALYVGDAAGVSASTSSPELPETADEAEAELPADTSADIDLDFDLANAETVEAAPEPMEAPVEEPRMNFDFDLTQPEEAPSTKSDLDFDLDLTTTQSPPISEDATPKVDDMEFDFDLGDTTPPPLEATATAAPTELPEEVKDLSLDLDMDTPAPEETSAPPETVADNELEGLDDLSNLEMDDGNQSDPLETKLSLAREFEAIGDTDGARSLAEEVEAEASGALKDRARAFLNQLA